MIRRRLAVAAATLALAAPMGGPAGGTTTALTQGYVNVLNGGRPSTYDFSNVIAGQNGRTIEVKGIENPGPGVSTVELQITPPTGQALGNGTFSSAQGWALNVFGINNGIPQCVQDLGTVSVDHATFDAGGDPLTLGVRFQFMCTNLGPSSSTSTTEITGALALGVSPTTVGRGYFVYGAGGKVTAFGNDSYLNYLGDLSGTPLNKPIVGMAVTPDGAGYWLAAADGGIFNYGDAGPLGSMGGTHLNQPIVGMAATPDGNGYWLAAADGGIFNFGDAGFHGSTGAMHLNQPIVGLAATPSGQGYWLVASDGGIFSFGDAGFHGSTGAMHLNKPIVGMAATPDGQGYWLVASDGGIFSFGEAGFHGSAGATHLTLPIAGMIPTASGNGYWLVASDGGIFNYGDATYDGSLGGAGVGNITGITR